MMMMAGQLSEPLGEYTPSARTTDPESSHAGAEKSFGSPWLRQAVSRVTSPHRWMSWDDLIVAIFGPGPYSLKEAKALNHIPDAAKELFRMGLLERRRLPGRTLEYKRI